MSISRQKSVTRVDEEGKVVKWMVESPFSFLPLIPAFQRCRSSSLIIRKPVEYVTMFRSTPTSLLIHTFSLFTTGEMDPFRQNTRNNFEILKKPTEVWDNS